MTARLMWACRCGHTFDVHAHYRPGVDCGLCGCMSFAPVGGRLRRVWRYLCVIVAGAPE